MGYTLAVFQIEFGQNLLTIGRWALAQELLWEQVACWQLLFNRLWYGCVRNAAVGWPFITHSLHWCHVWKANNTWSNQYSVVGAIVSRVNETATIFKPNSCHRKTMEKSTVVKTNITITVFFSCWFFVCWHKHYIFSWHNQLSALDLRLLLWFN